MKIIVLLLIAITHVSMYSQTLSGQVIDSLSNTKLAYANLVIKNTKIGVYSNEDGAFNLDISRVATSDTLVVSLIGFQEQRISLSDYNNTNNYVLNISLLPKLEALTEVLILSNTKVYEKQKTRLSTSKRKQVFPTSIPFGYETATLIENTKQRRGKLIEVELKFKDSSSEMYKTYQTYYRLAFYNVDDHGFPGELIYYEDIIIKPEKHTKNFKIDLEDQPIPFGKNGIFVGIETIKPAHVEITNSMYLTTPSILHTHAEKQLKFTRFHSNNWSKHSRKSVLKKKYYAIPFIKTKVVFEK
ncbi:carboxypeptidase-like regulatory domain-containing protein [Winogradskyella psychrotolerans]|uniref:carboxypeptidase-like regulatory domain-containing protein n=1 Tax=Winogradskyella psychrotolerans TaxID=1344585 RepID=UPI001C065B14|nr:carboxypeptidase-like regulatory domain-containing protein [Winogradskyella psychrotolerans]MBU2927217.1 carboxypeptidase-like regulatory domain-containing protein [Winogradskyella psychrotolerans]